MLAKLLTNLKLHEKQNKIIQILTISSNTIYEYINANKEKMPVKKQTKW